MKLPRTTSWCVTESCPKEFSTEQEYSPASTRVTAFISREPSGNWRILSLDSDVNNVPFTWGFKDFLGMDYK